MSLLRKLSKGIRSLRGRDYRRGLSMRVTPAIEHEHELLQLQPATVVDIGANRGQFTLLSRRLYPRARIFAFEPIAHAQSVFLRLFKEDPNVKLYPMALGSKVGAGILHVSKRDDSSSLLPIGIEQVRHFPGTGEVAQLKIEIHRMDDVLRLEDLNVPVLCKIDVQGYELEVIRGMGDLINSIQWMIIEVSLQELYVGQPLFDEVICEMQRLGFRLWQIYDPEVERDGELVQANCLFANSRPSHVL
jgi:FkbM family methyltransferase